MKTICITDNRSECNNYCPMCGVNNINAKGVVKECKHLVLIATSETIDNPEFDKENLILEQDKERKFSNTINTFNLSDYLVIKNWLSYAKIIGDESYKCIFDKKLNNIFFKNILDPQINLRNKELL